MPSASGGIPTNTNKPTYKKYVRKGTSKNGMNILATIESAISVWLENNGVCVFFGIIS